MRINADGIDSEQCDTIWVIVRQEAYWPDSSAMYTWLSGHRKFAKISSNIAKNHSSGLLEVISGHYLPKFI